MTIPVRGHVYSADVGFGSKPWLIVSNNQRNRNLTDVLAVRITTTSKDLPTWVPLTQADPLEGHVNTDNIETLSRQELDEYLGSLSTDTLNDVELALCIALGIQVAR